MIHNGIILEENNVEDIKVKLQLELREYNRPFLGQYERKNFVAYITDQEQKIIAGIYGFIITTYQTMRLELVWVEEKHRKRGFSPI